MQGLSKMLGTSLWKHLTTIKIIESISYFISHSHEPHHIPDCDISIAVSI